MTGDAGRDDRALGLASHPDLFRCVVVDDPRGGFDVALVVDGHYATRELAEDVLAFWNDRAQDYAAWAREQERRELRAWSAAVAAAAAANRPAR